MRLKNILITIIFFVSTTILYGQENLQIAEKLLSNQDYQEAYIIFADCAKDTLQYDCIEKAGIAAYRMGATNKAKDHFHKIELNPGFFKTASIHLANIYESEENIPKAIKYNIRLRDSFPENFLYHRKLGSLLMKASLPMEAFPEFAKALKLNPEDLTTIKSVAELFIQNNQSKEADSLLRKGLEIDRSNIGLNYLFARNFYKTKQYDSTVMVLMNLQGKVDFPNYYSKMLGYSLLQIDSVDQAIYFLNKSLVNETDPEYAHYYLANAYELKGDFESAIYNYDKAIEAGISSGLDLYFRNKARILNDENRFGEAIKAYEWSYRLNSDPVLLFYLGRASDKYYKDKSIAIRYYQKYLKSRHNNPDYKKYARQRARYLKENMHQASAGR